jgi:Tol biopolymer transport system component
VPLQGGVPVRLTGTEQNRLLGTTRPAVSPDSRFVAFEYKDEKTLKRRVAIMPIEGGPPVKTFDMEVGYGVMRWTRGGQALAYIPLMNDREIYVQSLAGGPPQKLFGIQDDLIFWFDLSPDGKQVLYTSGKLISDLILIRDLQPAAQAAIPISGFSRWTATRLNH